MATVRAPMGPPLMWTVRPWTLGAHPPAHVAAWVFARLLEASAGPVGLLIGRPVPAGGTALGVGVVVAFAGGSAAAIRRAAPGWRRRSRADRTRPVRPAPPIEPGERR